MVLGVIPPGSRRTGSATGSWRLRVNTAAPRDPSASWARAASATTLRNRHVLGARGPLSTRRRRIFLPALRNPSVTVGIRSAQRHPPAPDEREPPCDRRRPRPRTRSSETLARFGARPAGSGSSAFPALILVYLTYVFLAFEGTAHHRGSRWREWPHPSGPTGQLQGPCHPGPRHRRRRDRHGGRSAKGRYPDGEGPGGWGLFPPSLDAGETVVELGDGYLVTLIGETETRLRDPERYGTIKTATASRSGGRGGGLSRGARCPTGSTAASNRVAITTGGGPGQASPARPTTLMR